MSKFFNFKAFIKPTSFKINKGNIKLVKEKEDYSVKYPNAMEGHIRIDQESDGINIHLNKDFPSEDPIVINLNSLQTCNVNLESGVLRSEGLCPNMTVKVNSGTLSAKISKHNIASVKAHVNTGVLNNRSDLQPSHSHEGQSFGNFWEMNMGVSFNNHVELMGTGSSHATFQVDIGTMDLFSVSSSL